MKSLKRVLLASIGLTASIVVAAVLVLMAATVVWVGTGADPSDAFREPDLANTSLSADLVLENGTLNPQLGPVEAERLTNAWADAFALLERRSGGELVDFERRFDRRVAESLGVDGSWAPFSVLQHDISLEFLSTNRQVAALRVVVTVDRHGNGPSLVLEETYEAVFADQSSGWTIVTFNRVDALIKS